MSQFPSDGIEARLEREERQQEESERLLLRTIFLLASDAEYSKATWRGATLRQTRIALVERLHRLARRMSDASDS